MRVLGVYASQRHVITRRRSGRIRVKFKHSSALLPFDYLFASSKMRIHYESPTEERSADRGMPNGGWRMAGYGWRLTAAAFLIARHLHNFTSTSKVSLSCCAFFVTVIYECNTWPSNIRECVCVCVWAPSEAWIYFRLPTNLFFNIKCWIYKIFLLLYLRSDFCFSLADESPIQKFYKDKGVFLTGGTGFFGKSEYCDWTKAVLLILFGF